MAEEKFVYTLRCPVPDCREVMQALYFVNTNQTDDHGYICCCKCISTLARKVKIPVSRWTRFERKRMRKYPRQAWVVSYNRTLSVYDPAPAAAAAPAPVMRLPAHRDVVQDDEHSEVDDNGLL